MPRDQVRVAIYVRSRGNTHESRTSAQHQRAWEHRPLTYETDELRTYLPELLAGGNGPVVLQQCEEYVPESGRWEPFVSVLWESNW